MDATLPSQLKENEDMIKKLIKWLADMYDVNTTVTKEVEVVRYVPLEGGYVGDITIDGDLLINGSLTVTGGITCYKEGGEG